MGTIALLFYLLELPGQLGAQTLNKQERVFIFIIRGSQVSVIGNTIFLFWDMGNKTFEISLFHLKFLFKESRLTGKILFFGSVK